ncbi:hypothetical protein ACQEU6_19080 [Spirillospora sp. CA-108201]
MKPASAHSWTASTWSSTSSPQGTDSATSSGRTVFAAASKFTGPGSSAITFQAGAENFHVLWARCSHSS